MKIHIFPQSIVSILNLENNYLCAFIKPAFKDEVTNFNILVTYIGKITQKIDIFEHILLYL